MAFLPMGERVLVRSIKSEEKTKSGIYLSDPASLDMTAQAEVVAVGPGKRGYTGDHVPILLEVGETILYVKDTGIKIKVDEEELLLIQEEAVLGKVKN